MWHIQILENVSFHLKNLLALKNMMLSFKCQESLIDVLFCLPESIGSLEQWIWSKSNWHVNYKG